MSPAGESDRRSIIFSATNRRHFVLAAKCDGAGGFLVMSEPSFHEPPPSPPALVARLAGMMFLYYWSFGVWAVTAGAYIAANTETEGEGIFSAGFIGYSSAAGAVGSLLSPAIVGLLSDRAFAAQRLLAAAQFGCSAMAWGMFVARRELTFLLCLFGYFQCFFPAMAMTNKIAMCHLARPNVDFPRVRIAGTLGWIAAGLFVGLCWPWFTGRPIEATKIPLALAAVSSLGMALLALTLPHTPPDLSPEKPSASSPESPLSLVFGNRALTVFLAAAIFACTASVAYNSYANLYLNREGFPNPAALMTLGQASDLACLAAAPWLIAHFGLRRLFALGTFAWGMRYLLLAGGSHYETPWPIYAAIAIHGPCFTFVFVLGAMLVDELADQDQRGLAQGLFTVASTGAGNLLGAAMMGYAQERFLTPAHRSPPPYDWPLFWLVPAAVSGLAALAFVAAMRTTDGRRGNRQ